MTTLSHCRGNELADHRDAKLIARNLLLAAGFDTAFCEYRNSDVVGMRRDGNGLYVVAIEVERTVRNVLQNIRRDLACGCDHIIAACLSERVAAAAARLIVGNLSSDEQRKVTVIPFGSLIVSFLRDLRRPGNLDSGLIQVSSEVDSGKSEVGSA